MPADHKQLVALADIRASTASGDARALRIAARLSLREVGGACGVTGVTVLRWETGARCPRGDAALRYGALLKALAKPRQREVTADATSV